MFIFVRRATPIAQERAPTAAACDSWQLRRFLGFGTATRYPR